MVRLSRPIIIYFLKVVGSKIPIYRGWPHFVRSQPFRIYSLIII